MRNSKVFRRYVISFGSMALMACLLAGGLLMLLSGRELERTVESDLQIRLNTAKEDFANQVKGLEERALRIKIDPYFAPQYLAQQAIHEVELIERLQLYNQASGWNERIFLYYPSRDAAYSAKAKYRSHYFFAFRLAVEEPEKLQSDIQAAGYGEWMRANGDELLLTYPLRFGQSDERVYCLFLIEASEITRQTAFASGRACSLLKPGQAPLPDSREVAQTEVFRLSLHADARSRQPLMRLSFLMIALLCVLFLGIALYLAYLSYLPIKQLALRFPVSQAWSDDELEALGVSFDQVMTDRKDSQHMLMEQIRRMDEQKTAFRRQLLWLILNGKCSPETSAALSEIGIQLPGPYFAVLCVASDKPLTIGVLEEMAADLSDENISFCPVEWDGRMVVLTSLSECSQLPDAVDVLRAAGEANGWTLTLQIGQLCTSLAQLPGTLSGLDSEKCTQSIDFSITRWYDDGSLSLVFTALQQGHAELAMERMRILLDNVAQQHIPVSLQRCAWIDIFNRLVQYALDMRLPAPSELSEQLLCIQDQESALALLGRAIDTMTVGFSDEESHESSAQTFVNYVDKHACEINFNINCLTEQFNLSAKYIARQIRQQTGMPYRNYIIHLRIKEACHLLRSTDTPVCDIHERVGYSSASHFVKVFRTVTGMTPSAYRSDGYMLNPDSMRLDALEDERTD